MLRNFFWGGSGKKDKTNKQNQTGGWHFQAASVRYKGAAIDKM